MLSTMELLNVVITFLMEHSSAGEISSVPIVILSGGCLSLLHTVV